MDLGLTRFKVFLVLAAKSFYDRCFHFRLGCLYSLITGKALSVSMENLLLLFELILHKSWSSSISYSFIGSS
jgi:hypothetical protein